ncbi:MAG TPA: nitrate- and nitrite sensing domain-containing protein [Actinomycetes bacterium]|nr:nitrate- and nitrite sensing domain-containing protein [Actinomycetes bacterium]
MLANLPIRSKLIAVLVVPMLVLTVLTLIQIRSILKAGDQADRVNRLTGFAVELSAFVHELQRERGLSAGYVAAGAGYGGMIAQRVWVTQELRDFTADAAALDLDGFDSRLRQRLQAAKAELAKLGTQRQAIDDRRGTSVDGTFRYYSGAIANLLEVEAAIAAETDDSEVLRSTSAFTALARAKEATSQERDLVNAVLSVGRFGPKQYEQFVSVIGSEETWVAQFQSSATAPQREFYQRTATGAHIQRAVGYRNAVLESGTRGRIATDLSGGSAVTAGPGAKQAASSNAKNWYVVMTAKVDLLRQVESKLAADLVSASAASESSASRQAAVSSGVLLVALALTLGISLLVGRSMVGPLRRLRHTAIDVAEQRLPGAVERLQRGERVDVVAETAPIGIASRDEIGQVTEAFNSVHRVAVQVATDQAALRKSVADTFLNLARRSQTLIHRQLKMIDRLERKTTDPDELEELFRLDHLATRMRRNAEDLIVLSGAKPARRWGRPVPLNDVIRGAIGEVEDYTRVTLLPAAGLAVVGQAVGDVIHLLAELIENATSFSPPHTKVHVAGQPTATGYVVEIEDRGIGLSDAELFDANERLSSPPAMDLALSQRLGLFVVARLAEHHGIKVQLRHSWYGGVTALVGLPEALIARLSGMPEVAGGGRRGELAAPAHGEDDGEAPANGLPIFEGARSDWFAGGGELVHMPMDRHGAEHGVNGRLPVGRGPRAGIPPQGTPSQGTPSQGTPLREAGRRGPRPPDDAPLPQADDVLPLIQDELPLIQKEAGAPAPPAAAPGEAAAHLPRRVPQASLAPGIVANGQATDPEAGRGSTLPRRTPDDVRALLSSYRSSVERGRHVASTDAFRSSAGDDDDQAQ